MHLYATRACCSIHSVKIITANSSSQSKFSAEYSENIIRILYKVFDNGFVYKNFA